MISRWSLKFYRVRNLTFIIYHQAQLLFHVLDCLTFMGTNDNVFRFPHNGMSCLWLLQEWGWLHTSSLQIYWSFVPSCSGSALWTICCLYFADFWFCYCCTPSIFALVALVLSFEHLTLNNLEHSICTWSSYPTLVLNQCLEHGCLLFVDFVSHFKKLKEEGAPLLPINMRSFVILNCLMSE